MYSCRNKIIFCGPPNKETISLCNLQIQQYILTHIFEESITYILQSSDDNVICYTKDEKCNLDIINSFGNISIIRNINTFHQNDDNIRRNLYEILFPVLKKKIDNVLLIGGECYLFAAFCNAKNIYCYSDNENIVRDCKRNNVNCISELADYSKLKIPQILFDLCILNVSKKGLGKNLCTQIASFTCNTYYISCNEKSFNKDYELLQKKLSNFKYSQRWNLSYVSCIHLISSLL